MATLNTPRSKDDYRTKGVRRSLVSATSLSSTTESSRRDSMTNENYESVIFMWLDPKEQSNINIVGPLRAINDKVEAFTDSSSCFSTIRSSKEKIFFICSSSNNELIGTVHDLPAVEAIFILDPNAESIKGDFPKLFGIFNQQEELFRVLKEVFDIFEQTQLEQFAFEQDKVFLWSQLWKEELMSRKASSNKHAFIEIVRNYYRDNARIIGLIEEFEKSYRPAEVISWCFRSPFPARFLLHALRSHNKAQLNICRFLFTDATRFFQQQTKRKSSEQVYRGMKLSSELLAKFEAHVGQLVCTSGFFPSTKSRTSALTLASLPTHRPDLLSVLFKIDCDASSSYTEFSNKHSLPLIVFDVGTAFRIVYVNRGQMSIVKMKTAGEAGKKIALEYLQQYKNETIESLLDELFKPPTPQPVEPTLPPVPIKVFIDPVITAEETKARKYAEKGETDLALVTYRRIQPVTARVLNAMGQLSADRKWDYDYALQCHKQALIMQEESGEDMSDTLTFLGNVYHNRREFDLALHHHTDALKLREVNPSTEPVAITSSLIGIANAHWARREYSEAIGNAERALALQEARLPADETSVATTLALLGNIYQDSGNSAQALDLCTKALTRFESIVSANSPILAELLYKLGVIQSSLGVLTDAQHSLERSGKIYRNLLPRGHQDRALVENELRRVIELRQQ